MGGEDGVFCRFSTSFNLSFYSVGSLDLQAKQSVHAGMTDTKTEMKTEIRTDP